MSRQRNPRIIRYPSRDAALHLQASSPDRLDHGYPLQQLKETHSIRQVTCIIPAISERTIFSRWQGTERLHESRLSLMRSTHAFRYRNRFRGSNSSMQLVRRFFPTPIAHPETLFTREVRFRMQARWMQIGFVFPIGSRRGIVVGQHYPHETLI